MDAFLVEKITRLVLSKLVEYSQDKPDDESISNQRHNFTNSTMGSNIQPLSESELLRWEKLSSAFSLSPSTSPNSGHEYLPLTEEEIINWQHVSYSIEKRNPVFTAISDKVRGFGEVKFYRHY